MFLFMYSHQKLNSSLKHRLNTSITLNKYYTYQFQILVVVRMIYVAHEIEYLYNHLMVSISILYHLEHSKT